MAIYDAPIPRGLYSDGQHWIYYKVERQLDVINCFCAQVSDDMNPNTLVEITSITMKDFSRVSISETIKLMREFLSPFKKSSTPIVWKLSVDHNDRLTLDRKKMFMRAQEDIAQACGFRKIVCESMEITNKYYYYA